MDKENKTCASRRRMSADDLKREQLYELIEQALESMVESGQMEKRFYPEDGKTRYRLRQGSGSGTNAVCRRKLSSTKIMPARTAKGAMR